MVGQTVETIQAIMKDEMARNNAALIRFRTKKEKMNGFRQFGNAQTKYRNAPVFDLIQQSVFFLSHKIEEYTCGVLQLFFFSIV